MQENLKKHHVTNVRLKCMDFLETNVEKYDRVEYILLDPSCSGSGMVSRLKFGDLEREQTKDEERVERLSKLQKRMLLHAMSFPNVKRIVYSTCSKYEEENECVVRYALKKCRRKYNLVNIFEDKWKNGRGIIRKELDKQMNIDFCIRTSYENNFTNGFFIACFEKLNNLQEEQNEYENKIDA
jgi:25S rRNA (cytosine2278-C5)-methyltransferase